jgi:SAM-dependent methyltransferase
LGTTQIHPEIAQTSTSPGASASLAQTLLLSTAVFLSAFLLFWIEPLFAKVILPWFGGTAAVWATCLVFFQCALLLGYFYADVSSRRLPPARQAILHIALLATCAVFLPVRAHEFWRSRAGIDPAWSILGLLTTSIGLPFVVLSATSPLIQTWYARTRSEADPYHLFSLSNFASLLALLSFPLLIEPNVALHAQALLWSALFIVFAVICSASAWGPRRALSAASSNKEAMGTAVIESSAAPHVREKLLWLGLAACGSMLLLSITNHLLENVAPVPLLWVLPLAIYLLTFTMAFSRRRLYSRWWMVRFLAVALGTLGYAIYEPSYTESIQVGVPFFCIGLFLCCLFCHGELANRRPSPRHLTSFYMMVSLGGALGAIFVGLVAPHVFTAISEFPVTLVFAAVLAILALWEEGWIVRAFWAAASVVMIFVLVRSTRAYEKDTIVRVRNFYAALRVKQFSNWLKEPYRTLYHGKIEHGAQYVNPPASLLPTTYYGPDSGVGLALNRCCNGAKRVGVIGLGAGTLAAYGIPGDYFRFYDINPQVLDIAQTYFSYLRNAQAKTDIILGDARLSLESEAAQQFDVLAVDAFSGDAIPVHLLTKEGMAVYARHLKPDGILAIHTSNTFLNLPPLVQLLAADAYYSTRMISNEDNHRKLIDASDWVLVTRNKKFLNDLDASVFMESIEIPPKLRLWTDDYNNLFRILRPVRMTEPAPR